MRFVCIYLPYWKAEWYIRRHPYLKGKPLVLYLKQGNSMIVSATNHTAALCKIKVGMPLASVKAMYHDVLIQQEPTTELVNVLQHIATWCIRYTPLVAIDPPDTIVLNATGCCHLWQGEQPYINDIIQTLHTIGYTAKATIASTIASAWAASHYSNITIVPDGHEITALHELPTAALRLPTDVVEQLTKLGLYTIKQVRNIQNQSLQRRFGKVLVERFYEITGCSIEPFVPIAVPITYRQQLECLEPIRTRDAINNAVQQLLHGICRQLQQQGCGARFLRLTTTTIDKVQQQFEIGTNRASCNAHYLYQLFTLKLDDVAPGWGIELLLMEVLHHQKLTSSQINFWNSEEQNANEKIAILADKINNKIGPQKVFKYLPAEHHWPERSITKTTELHTTSKVPWRRIGVRPTILLTQPERITVMAPIPDYPPIQFVHKKVVHKIVKADGPERIEQEWWIQDGQHRDYYYVEDTEGKRYWLFRLGHYNDGKNVTWYLHGYCG